MILVISSSSAALVGLGEASAIAGLAEREGVATAGSAVCETSAPSSPKKCTSALICAMLASDKGTSSGFISKALRKDIGWSGTILWTHNEIVPLVDDYVDYYNNERGQERLN